MIIHASIMIWEQLFDSKGVVVYINGFCAGKDYSNMSKTAKIIKENPQYV